MLYKLQIQQEFVVPKASEMAWFFIPASVWNPEQIKAISRRPSVTHDTPACTHHTLPLSYCRGRNVPSPPKADLSYFSSNCPPLIQSPYINTIPSPSNLSFFLQRNSKGKRNAFARIYSIYPPIYPTHSSVYPGPNFASTLNSKAWKPMEPVSPPFAGVLMCFNHVEYPLFLETCSLLDKVLCFSPTFFPSHYLLWRIILSP